MASLRRKCCCQGSEAPPLLVRNLPVTLDVHAVLDACSIRVLELLHRGLVKRTAAGAILGDLAESWTISPDGLTAA